MRRISRKKSANFISDPSSVNVRLPLANKTFHIRHFRYGSPTTVESPHLGEIKRMRKQCVPGASPFFARAGDEAILRLMVDDLKKLVSRLKPIYRSIKQFHLVCTFIIQCLFSSLIKCSETSLGAVVILPLIVISQLQLTFSDLKQVIHDQTRQNGYQTVPFSVYIHNLMFVFILE